MKQPTDQTLRLMIDIEAAEYPDYPERQNRWRESINAETPSWFWSCAQCHAPAETFDVLCANCGTHGQIKWDKGTKTKTQPIQDHLRIGTGAFL
jgi:hypothetical protein